MGASPRRSTTASVRNTVTTAATTATAMTASQKPARGCTLVAPSRTGIMTKGVRECKRHRPKPEPFADRAFALRGERERDAASVARVAALVETAIDPDAGPAAVGAVERRRRF
ncbi:MAG: hypothetical protein K0S78_3359 [Thermomicrobiales bacterium]|nr:hypothetical protein [Thermomicrobiales bacterium]